MINQFNMNKAFEYDLDVSRCASKVKNNIKSYMM